ncbi:hypothetical protein [Prevotella intermedia]|uniref:hypothetical protein n=1 Tax=Prevotella intermedia TaxID=28131 RepID=UPI00095827EF|nr:hypothetical protein [Prevotella intermedia]APW34374.1 hypothetical protein BWX40_05730 [Prevotella intermedia]
MTLSFNYLVISALQNLLFCIPKAAVLQGKSVGFAAQNSRFRNVKTQLSLFKRIIFTKPTQKVLTTTPIRLAQKETGLPI